MFSTICAVFIAISLILLFALAIFLFYLAIYECAFGYFVYSAALDLLCCCALFSDNMETCSNAAYISLGIIGVVAYICMYYKKAKEKQKQKNI